MYITESNQRPDQRSCESKGLLILKQQKQYFAEVSLDCKFSLLAGSNIGEFRTDLGLLARQPEQCWKNRVRCAVSAAPLALRTIWSICLVDFCGSVPGTEGSVTREPVQHGRP
jgi:hypothetical protein